MSAHTIAMTPAILDYLGRLGHREPPVLARLRAETLAATGEWSRMQIAPEQGAFMAMLVRLLQPRAVIEIGTFTGYSSTAMALALPPGGHITCCDVSAEYTAMARAAWREAGVEAAVTLHLQPAMLTIASLLAEGRAGGFDLGFIDADKGNYPAYYEGCLQLLRPGGLLLIDNVLWDGQVAAREQDQQTRIIHALNQTIHADPRVEMVLVPIGDGLTLVRKL